MRDNSIPESQIPVVITSELKLSTRLQHYKEGGVIIITSRILICDLLKDRIRSNNIKNIYIYESDKLHNHCSEIFICNLLKEKNENAKIICLTDNSNMINTYSSNNNNSLYHICMDLKVDNVILYPRFEKRVIKCVEEHPTEVIQFKQDMSEKMKKLELLLIRIIDDCIKGMKLENNTLFQQNQKDISFDKKNYLNNRFMKRLENVLERCKLKYKYNDTMNYIKSIHSLLKYLITTDCVTFYEISENVSIELVHKELLWLMDNEFSINIILLFIIYSFYLSLLIIDELIELSKSRVYESNKSEDGQSMKIDILLEKEPKYELINNIFHEIEECNNERNNIKEEVVDYVINDNYSSDNNLILNDIEKLSIRKAKSMELESGSTILLFYNSNHMLIRHLLFMNVFYINIIYMIIIVMYLYSLVKQ